MAQKHIVFVGGGTAGHIQPIWAVMAALERLAPEYDIELRGSFIGLENDIQSDIVQNSLPRWCRAYPVSSGKLHRHLSMDQFAQISRFAKGMAGARKLLRILSPDLMFTKGGYVSVPLAWAAHRDRIPLYTHETDVVPGLANTWIARYADTVFTAYPTEYYRHIPKQKLHYVGQPVRSEFYEAAPANLYLENREIDLSQPILTVIGGSQGARRVNGLISSEWENYAKEGQLIHICGQRDYETLKEKWLGLPEACQKRIWLMPFVGPELPGLFKISTLVISRAGGTLSELAATGVPTILLPLSTAAQNHQAANAKVFEQAGAAVVLNEVRIDSGGLFDKVKSLLKDKKRQASLSVAIKKLAKPEAADSIAHTILKRLNS